MVVEIAILDRIAIGICPSLEETRNENERERERLTGGQLLSDPSHEEEP